MDKNSITGLLLIFLLLIAWTMVTSPTEEQIAEQNRIRDSINVAQSLQDSLTNIGVRPSEVTQQPQVANIPDSLKAIQLSGSFGPFAASASGTESEHVLENDVFKITFSNKGGYIKDVLLKKYQKLVADEAGEESKEPLHLMEDLKNRFDYFLPVGNISTGAVRTGDLYFDAQKQGNSIVFRANAGAGQYFEQKYTIGENYNVNYEVQMVGLNNVLRRDAQSIKLNWVNYLDRVERNTSYEKNYSTAYYKPVDDGYDYCSCTGDDQEDVDGQRIQWVSHSHQFFNSTLMSEDVAFASANLKTQMMEDDNKDMKKLETDLMIPLKHQSNERFAMNWYIGPNKYENLEAYDNDLAYIIPFGSGIFGTVNRWIIRPLFDFLSSFIGGAGIVIFVLTLLVKMVLFPLTYKMLYSQSKMQALKPRIEKLGEKFGDDAQAKQVETMKMYREYGVNPLGGCMPMILQMPIWFALYRFFPASIEFRQASFLWASDLSSFDVFANLPFEIPFYGAHVSLFTLLWAISTLIYTYYNSRHMDMSANPAMAYMQYFMPVMFLFFFNNFASGLTCYLLFSNIINIAQTAVTKNYIINKDKIEQELSDYKKKPKKKSGFQERLEKAMKEQQKVQTDRETKGRKKKKR